MLARSKTLRCQDSIAIETTEALDVRNQAAKQRTIPSSIQREE